MYACFFTLETQSQKFFLNIPDIYIILLHTFKQKQLFPSFRLFSHTFARWITVGLLLVVKCLVKNKSFPLHGIQKKSQPYPIKEERVIFMNPQYLPIGARKNCQDIQLTFVVTSTFDHTFKFLKNLTVWSLELF